jgi:hypothetical protein
MVSNSDIPDQIEYWFPKLLHTGYAVTSPIDKRYNCFAHAAGDANNFWDPESTMAGYYWPTPATRQRTLPAFREAYETLGYTQCDQESYEEGFTKVAIFAKDNKPTHASLQIGPGLWSSKIGRHADISHDLRSLCGPRYGDVALILKRPGSPSPE